MSFISWSGMQFDSTPEPDRCTCSMQDLMVRGCTCGQMERERSGQMPFKIEDMMLSARQMENGNAD